MAGLELVLLCLAVSAGLRILAERLKVPYAAVLVVGGYLLFRRTWPIVDAAWHNALLAAQGAGKAK